MLSAKINNRITVLHTYKHQHQKPPPPPPPLRSLSFCPPTHHRQPRPLVRSCCFHSHYRSTITTTPPPLTYHRLLSSRSATTKHCHSSTGRLPYAKKTITKKNPELGQQKTHTFYRVEVHQLFYEVPNPLRSSMYR